MLIFKLTVIKPLLYRATKSSIIPEISIYELSQTIVTGNFHQRCLPFHVSLLGRPLASPTPASPVLFPSYNTNFLPATAAKFSRRLCIQPDVPPLPFYPQTKADLNPSANQTQNHPQK